VFHRRRAASRVLSRTPLKYLPDHRMSGEHRKLLASTLAGTTIEWYDFFV
jgi:hypothetical protein